MNGVGIRTLTSVVPLPRPDWGTAQNRIACEPRARQAPRGPGRLPEDGSAVGTQPAGRALRDKRDAHRRGDGGGWRVLCWAPESWAEPGEGSGAQRLCSVWLRQPHGPRGPVRRAVRWPGHHAREQAGGGA